MKKVTIADAKKHLSALIDLVHAGERVVITDRGRAVAMIEPMASSADPAGRMLRLQRAGLIRLGTGAVSTEFLRTPPPPLTPGSSAVDAVLDERRTGR